MKPWKQKVYTSMSVINSIYKYMLVKWYLHALYWCKMNTHGAADFFLVCIDVYVIQICYILVIYLVYTWYIQVICRCHTYGGYIRSKTFLGLFLTFFYNDIPWILFEYQNNIKEYQWYMILKKVLNKPKNVLLCIYQPYVWYLHMIGIYHIYIYHVYTIHRPDRLWYYSYIPGIY